VVGAKLRGWNSQCFVALCGATTTPHQYFGYSLQKQHHSNGKKERCFIMEKASNLEE